MPAATCRPASAKPTASDVVGERDREIGAHDLRERASAAQSESNRREAGRDEEEVGARRDERAIDRRRSRDESVVEGERVVHPVADEEGVRGVVRVEKPRLGVRGRVRRRRARAAGRTLSAAASTRA